jgi:REP element-mobilizing transposase RayT
MISLVIEPGRGQQALRRGRESLNGASYFLTICTEGRNHGLETRALASEVLRYAGDTTCGWILRSATVMPDHVHLIVDLGPSAGLSEAIRLFKGWSARALREQGIKWQSGFFDHRLRENEDSLPVFLYIFLNPYRAGLIPVGGQWPGYYCSPNDWTWLEPLTNSSLPFPEWLVNGSRRKAAPTGE